MGIQIGPTVQTRATDNSEKEVLDDISKYGWHCVSILPENDLAPYSFTVSVCRWPSAQAVNFRAGCASLRSSIRPIPARTGDA